MTGKCNYFWVEKEKEGPIIEEVSMMFDTLKATYIVV